MTGSPQSLSLGQLGSDFIEDTDPHVGTWGVIYCISSCTFTTLTPGLLPNGEASMTGTTADITLTAGMSIAGLFTAITLASGKVVAYRS